MLRTLIQATYSAEAGLEVYSRLSRRFGRHKTTVFLACMPKTGSTFLKSVLLEVTGFTEGVLTYAFERTEQELYLPRLIDASRRNTVTQQHVRATAANVDLMRRFRIRPVILVRNLFDVVVSIRDHLMSEGTERFPSLYATEHLASLDEQEQYAFLIHYAIPWYFNFFVSWYDAKKEGRIDALTLTYEELSEHWVPGVSRILEHFGISRDDEEIRRALNTVGARREDQVRFNKGVVGRGLESLNEANQDKIRRMTRFYPWVDFSAVGL
jgi:hypothetical protein